MSSPSDRDIKALTNETLSSSKLINTDTTYAIYAVLNATIDPFTDVTSLLDISSNDIFNNYDNRSNETIDNDELLKRDHVFDRTDVRVIFTIIYTLVFCCCFFGKFKYISFFITDNLIKLQINMCIENIQLKKINCTHMLIVVVEFICKLSIEVDSRQ